MLKIGVWLQGHFQDPGEYLADARALEAADAHSVWVGHHPAPENTDSQPGPEALLLLAAIASVTYRVRLGVSLLTPAPPLADLMGSMLDTLDRVSRGRAILALSDTDGEPRLETLLAGLRQSREGMESPRQVLLVVRSDLGHRSAVRWGDGVICPGEPAAMQPIFQQLLELRRAAQKQEPFELWALVRSPDGMAAWRETRAACEAAGATGLIVPFGPRLVDMLRRGDETQEDDRSDLLMSYG